MDYSLLLGTHIVTEEEKARAKYIYKLRLQRYNKLTPKVEISETSNSNTTDASNNNNNNGEKKGIRLQLT